MSVWKSDIKKVITFSARESFNVLELSKQNDFFKFTPRVRVAVWVVVASAINEKGTLLHSRSKVPNCADVIILFCNMKCLHRLAQETQLYTNYTLTTLIIYCRVMMQWKRVTVENFNLLRYLILVTRCTITNFYIKYSKEYKNVLLITTTGEKHFFYYIGLHWVFIISEVKYDL